MEMCTVLPEQRAIKIEILHTPIILSSINSWLRSTINLNRAELVHRFTCPRGLLETLSDYEFIHVGSTFTGSLCNILLFLPSIFFAIITYC